MKLWPLIYLYIRLWLVSFNSNNNNKIYAMVTLSVILLTEVIAFMDVPEEMTDIPPKSCCL